MLEGPIGVAREELEPYDPDTETIVLDRRHDAIHVIVIRPDGVETEGTQAFVTPTSRQLGVGAPRNGKRPLRLWRRRETGRDSEPHPPARRFSYCLSNTIVPLDGLA